MTPFPWLMPDRIRDVVDETNVTLADIRDKYKELEKIASMAEHDTSDAVKRTLRKVTREFDHLSNLMRMRAAGWK